MSDRYSNSTLTNVVFDDNSSVSGGGGLATHNSNSEPTLINTILWSNTAPGLPATDLDGKVRIEDVIVDMGAYECNTSTGIGDLKDHVTTLVDGSMDEGFKKVTWDGKDSRGNQVSTGVYFYRLTAGKQTLTKKMILLK